MTRPHMKRAEHRRLWRIISGAVKDAMAAHPDYVTPQGRASMVNSITKRAVGNLVGHAKQSRKG